MECGAICMIVFLQHFKKSNVRLFVGGIIIGDIVEYLVSLIGELILHVKWWDYSNMPFNINGRICVFFSAFWGILAVFLMANVNPKVDQLIDRISKRISMVMLRMITVVSAVILLADCMITGYALRNVFYA